MLSRSLPNSFFDGKIFVPDLVDRVWIGAGDRGGTAPG
jgi:hypothetical protein